MKKKQYSNPAITIITIQQPMLLAGSGNADWDGPMGAPKAYLGDEPDIVLDFDEE